MNTSDATLLGRFVRERNEAAFTELARRHGGLIFHTALRRTFNHAMAQEVSQQVLCALARKAANLARTVGEDGLGPWLHRATVFEASKALRAEASHQHRKQLQHPDSMPATGSEANSWEDALPHLDPALDKLGEGDRRVVILRFFRRLSFEEIAASSGRSVDAVRRQSSRAIEKLSGLLRARGVILPVTVLAAGLTAESAKAAPVALLSTLTTHAFTTTVTLPSNPLLVMITTKTKVLVPVAVIVCAVPIILQQSAISSSERQLATLQESKVSTTAPADSQSADKRQARPGTVYTGLVSANRDWRTLMNEHSIIESPEDFAAFIAKLETMSLKERVQIIKEVAAEESIAQIDKASFFSEIIYSLSETDPGAGVRAVMDVFKGEPSFDYLYGNSIASGYRGWIQKDPAAVRDWLDRMKQERAQGGWFPASFVENFQVPLLSELVCNDPAGARAMLEKESPEVRQELMLKSVLEFLKPSGARPALETLTYLQYARELPTKHGDEPLLKKMASRIAEDNRVQEIQTWFEQGNLSAKEKQTIGSVLASSIVLDAADQSAAKQALLKKVMPEDADRLVQQARTESEK